MKLLRTLFALLFLVLSNSNARAVPIIRDAEIEETLTEMAQTIFKIAGLRTESAKVYVVNSEEINAFTIGNGYIFINSGLLLEFENPLELMGILCHEAGHIAAGHINRQISVMQQRSTNFTFAMLAGILGAAIAGSEEAIAILLGYAMTDERFYLRFSRGEEFAADALAATYLEKLGYGSDVMISAFSLFQRMDILNGGANLPVYVRSHPKTSDRVSALQKRAKGKIFKADKTLIEKYNRVLLKLKAYLGAHDLFTRAPDDAYSKAVYLHRIGKSKEAITLFQKLLKDNPNDKYYKEALAQTFFEDGQLSKAVEMYRQIYEKNLNPLIKIDYANVLIEAGEKIETAIAILERAKYTERFNSDIFRLLAKAYGKHGKEGLSFLMLAQEQMLLQNYKLAAESLSRCLSKLNPKTESSEIKKAKYLKELLERDYKEHL